MKHEITKCRYCGGIVYLKTSQEFYGEDYGTSLYVCENNDCGAYVGTHAGTSKPLGTLARKDLRNMRRSCHRMFDPLWKTGIMTRDEAYVLLQERMGMSPEEAHIGMFDEKDCRRMLVLFQRGVDIEAGRNVKNNESK